MLQFQIVKQFQIVTSLRGSAVCVRYAYNAGSKLETDSDILHKVSSWKKIFILPYLRFLFDIAAVLDCICTQTQWCLLFGWVPTSNCVNRSLEVLPRWRQQGNQCLVCIQLNYWLEEHLTLLVQYIFGCRFSMWDKLQMIFYWMSSVQILCFHLNKHYHSVCLFVKMNMIL